MASPTDGSEGPCYELAAEAGQTATLSIKGQNVAMSVEDIGDDPDPVRIQDAEEDIQGIPYADSAVRHGQSVHYDGIALIVIIPLPSMTGGKSSPY